LRWKAEKAVIRNPTVLILGAGASKPYGLPLGWELRRRILALSANDLNALPILPMKSRPPREAANFLHEFRHSTAPSIDAFLERRPEYIDLGRMVIASVLLPLEEEELLFNDLDGKDDWYSYLLNAMDAPWADFASNQISFVTFNYDRSLERFLFVALQHRYGRSEDEVREMLIEFPITHVYGRLGDPDTRSRVPIEYGGARQSHWTLSTAAEQLQIISEGRDDADSFATAKRHISQAQNVCFLGFGFDQTNVRRLGGTDIRASGWINEAGVGVSANFAATCLGLTEAEKRGAADSISINGIFRNETISKMHPIKCTALLRETLILQA
jgi:hypothetical protein